MELESEFVGKSPLRAPSLACAALMLCLVVSLGALACASDGGADPSSTASGEEPSGRLEPRYQPREPEPEPFYNSDLLFAMTRGVTDSTIHPGAQIPLLVLTIPLDIVFLPFAAIAGFF